jgi:NAD(P)-dependent dehydrogenase (short-subunit alcohol dehydrogenase family)
MKDLRDRVAAITGAASGIGRALALELAEQGAELAISDIDGPGVEKVAGEVAERGVRVSHAALDVADRAAVYAWADRVVADHGRVNLVINNAGVTVGASIEDIAYEDFEWLMGIDFWGVVYGTKAFLPHLIASGDGHVVNLSSIFGLIGVPGQCSYNAAKFAVRGFTECLRQELEIAGHPVSASCVHPGGIRTDIARNARFRVKEGALEHEQVVEQFDKMARTSPEDAARAILKGVRDNDRRILVGVDATVVDSLQRWVPTGYQWLVSRVARWRKTVI